MPGNLYYSAMVRKLKGLTAVFGLWVMSVSACASEAHASKNVVYVNGIPVLEIKTKSSPGVLVSNVVKALRIADDDAEVKTKKVGRDCMVSVGTVLAVTVTPVEAALHGTTVDRLAETWANQIRDALSLPPLKFSVDFLKVPVGTTKEIGLVGSLALGATISTTDQNVLKVTKTETGLRLTCVGAGDAQLKAISGNSMRTLGVSVRPYAGIFPQNFVAEVTGSPASEAMVAGAIEECIHSKLVCLPTANCSYEPIRAEALSSDRSSSFTIRVRLRATDAFDSVGNVSVTVRNVVLPKLADVALWYSNAPESVHQVSPLFSSSLKQGEPVRFLYHHIDASSQPIILRVEAINDSDLSARVLITPGDSKPDKNPVRAGLTAANQFFRAWKTDSGEIVTVPPHSTFPISIRRLSPKETASGLCELRLIDGPPDLQVRTDALPPFDLQGAWYDASQSSTPWRDIGTRPINDYDRAMTEPSLHVYPNPYKVEQMAYTVGGRYGFLLIGQKPISGEGHTNNLDGNFGVLYRIKANIRNPSDTATDVDLVFEASAGYMGGIFLVDGNLIQTPLLSPKGESRIGRFHLPVGASRTLEIITIPVSGGSYPATLFLRPAETALR